MNAFSALIYIDLLKLMSSKDAVLSVEPSAMVTHSFQHPDEWVGHLAGIVCHSNKGSDDCWRKMKVIAINSVRVQYLEVPEYPDSFTFTPKLPNTTGTKTHESAAERIAREHRNFLARESYKRRMARLKQHRATSAKIDAKIADEDAHPTVTIPKSTGVLPWIRNSKYFLGESAR